MADNKEALLVAAKGYVLYADVNTAPITPAALLTWTPDSTTLTGWTSFGRTSKDDLPEFGFDGGDSSTIGTWQNGAERTIVTDLPVDTVTFTLAQFDETAFQAYYGTDNVDLITPGVWKQTAASVTPMSAALMVIIVDGPYKVAFYASHTEITRDDSISLADDAFSGLPVHATILDPIDSANGRIQWIGEHINEADAS